MINSVFDPIGFLQPVIIEGKLLLREMMSVTSKTDWDDRLPEPLHDKWTTWIGSLNSLESMDIPKVYSHISFADATQREVLVFSDAYLKLYDEEGSSTSFLMGKAKLVPTHGHTIPRLELCAAVLVR